VDEEEEKQEFEEFIIPLSPTPEIFEASPIADFNDNEFKPPLP
jgi:hypothetical protein